MMRQSIRWDCLAVVMLSVVFSSPVISSLGFAGGAACVWDGDSVKCATGGPPNSVCEQDRSTCKAGTTWETCVELEGNESEACKNDNACASGKNALRSGHCEAGS